MSQNAVLAVSFGTSYRDTLEKNITAIEREIAAAFPGFLLRRAFTSGMIMRKLKQRDNLAIDTVSEALERLLAEGVTHVVMQPTHILAGDEYDKMMADAAPFAKRFSSLRVGAPLLGETADYQQLVSVLSEAFEQTEGGAICLMGHGTRHYADSAYAALDYHFKAAGRPDIFVGTVEGYPDLQTLMRQVKVGGAERVTLAPLMVVAGDHIINDMAGDGEDSWKTAFEAAGFAVSCVLKGLGEYPAVRALYASHARNAVDMNCSAEVSL